MKKKILGFLLVALAMFSSCSYSNKIMPAPQWRIVQVRVISCDNMYGVDFEQNQIDSLCKLANKINFDSTYNNLLEIEYLIEITYRTIFWNSCQKLFISNGYIFNEYGDMTSVDQAELVNYIEQTYHQNFTKLKEEL